MWQIKEKKSIGDFYIGDDINKYIELLGEYTTFKQSDESDDITYTFYDESVYLTCGDDQKINTISVFNPNSVSYLGIELIDKKVSKIKKELNAKKIKYENNDVGIWLEDAGICLVEYEGNVDCVELYSE